MMEILDAFRRAEILWKVLSWNATATRSHALRVRMAWNHLYAGSTARSRCSQPPGLPAFCCCSGGWGGWIDSPSICLKFWRVKGIISQMVFLVAWGRMFFQTQLDRSSRSDLLKTQTHHRHSHAGCKQDREDQALQVALWTRNVITSLDMCKVCNEAVHSVALWTRTLPQVWTCVKYVTKQSTP